MKSAWIVVVVAVAIGSITICRATRPERVVWHNTVTSRRDPAVEIKLPSLVPYVGTDRFLHSAPKLGNFDACELYAFVDSDRGGHVRKFYVTNTALEASVMGFTSSREAHFHFQDLLQTSLPISTFVSKPFWDTQRYR